jgi:predicted nucleic acid-binding protein
VPLLLPGAAAGALLMHLERDPDMLVWWGTSVECASALARREREGSLSDEDAMQAAEKLRGLALEWQEVLPVESVRTTAHRLLRLHPLRAADALQLAAASVTAEGDPSALPFVCLDERLAEAARREGFPVLPRKR